MAPILLDDDPLWYQNALIYELHVKTFFDSDDDGTGEFQGLTKKLDYLASLGVTAIWLLPFYPSPLRDDGYDIADYFDIHPQYGQLHDFRRFLYEAHRRGLRVITELVINHTSDQHPWFQKARRSKPGSTWRNYYVWSETPEKYKDARIIFKDFEPSNWSWDPVAKSYYWHRFYSHQPDLNFENPRVQKEIFRVLDFWLEMGVDGMRLDAVPYLFEQEGTNCENLPQTHVFLKKLRAHVDGKYKNRMLLAEANQWPEDAVEYLGKGDECHMAFHFPIMPRLFMGIQMEDRFPIISILEQTPDIPQNCQWAMFLRNHDELTLEMVTDEERDYMWRTFAEDAQAKINFGIRRRLSPLLGGNRRKIELMNILLFSLPGTPVIYYGDEIGMGDNYYLGDRNGVRTPMQWSPDRNAGFSKANSQKLLLPLISDPEYHYEAVNVESQERNLSSLLWWMKRVIAMRKRCVAFGRGSLKFVSSNNHRILSFMREYEDEKILVVANLSRFAQMVELDLSEYAGWLPEEVFSHNKFPLVREIPYMLTLGPHGHFWLQLKKEENSSTLILEEKIPDMGLVSGNWKRIFEDPYLAKMEKDILPKFLKGKRWFGAKARTIRKISVFEKISLVKDPHNMGSFLTLLQVQFSSGQPELYLLPLAFAYKENITSQVEKIQNDIICTLHVDGKEALIYDAVYDAIFCAQLLKLIVEGRKIKARLGDLQFYSGSKL
ncbi:MAG: maltose alpha-D-glucosyltransferase, partial [Chlamydiota bacterium]|nr:maltose alpha-D-glucosyltransferase [Chlamydiota bacterium]